MLDLTKTVNIGGGKGGADFDLKDKSDNETWKFCVNFMRELCKHIGADTDVPAGDIGWDGVLTGKGGKWGGSLIRLEATGFGLVYYVSFMIAYAGQGSFKGKKVAISGSGNVVQYAAIKAIELSASVVSISDSNGSLLVPEGASFSLKDVKKIAVLNLKHQSHGIFNGPKPIQIHRRLAHDSSLKVQTWDTRKEQLTSLKFTEKSIKPKLSDGAEFVEDLVVKREC
ncbi:hypothetical protein B7463_g8600, partial [Scytalidium lignicola]